MKTEVYFSDVKLGESFEFHTQLLACVAVKAMDAMVIGIHTQRSKNSNFVITKILPTATNALNRVPGDYEWCPENAIVIVDRCLPSGS